MSDDDTKRETSRLNFDPSVLEGQRDTVDRRSIFQKSKELGREEGFTPRQAPARRPARPTVQVNIKMDPDLHRRLHARFNEIASVNRAVRNMGDFVDLLLTYWDDNRK